MGEMNLSEAGVFVDGFPEEGTLELNKRSVIKMEKYVLGLKDCTYNGERHISGIGEGY